MTEAAQIYIAPNIRTQTLEQAQSRIVEKRVARLLMAAKHQETSAMKATKLRDKALLQFKRQEELFEKNMERVVDLLDKMNDQVFKMNEIHSAATNCEGIIDGEPNF
jgi:hypothetical protein